MTELLRDIVRRSRGGEAIAIPSVCTAHADVLRACLALAAARGRPIVVEATSNQVNQFGGYTGLDPAAFAASVQELADQAGLAGGLLLGGDHLGPQAWRSETAADAMAKAADMVRAYVRAGFTKIHLDCSEACADDTAPPDDGVAAERAAALAVAALDAAPDPADLVFVVGTEVPPPGGARTDEGGEIAPTPNSRIDETLAAHRDAFEQAGIGDAFGQVAGLVVQPGVEFTPTTVHHFPPDRALGYRAVLQNWPGIVLEAHSTDYQRPEVFHRLAVEGFAFQKVGPALTFAWRQAIYALDLLRGTIEPGAPSLVAVMEELMTGDPSHWAGHYRGGDREQRLARHFGYADRIRYYWARPEARRAVGELLDWASGQRLSDGALLQVFAPDVIARARTLGGPLVRCLVDASVQGALNPYFVTGDQGSGKEAA